MTGESVTPRERRSRQPGGRPAAPGQLALVQAFINTHFDLEHEHGAELLHSPGALYGWLSEHGLIDTGNGVVGPEHLRRALALREALRAFAADGRAQAARERLDEAAAGAPVELRFAPDGPRFVGARRHGVDGALGALLAIVAQSIAGGSWSRLKICPGHHCGWAFYDNSRNRSGRWCSMSVCGGREKARAHYRRRRADEAVR
jgi:predicted RNA-binding Zn ribbon-like protein